MSLDNKLRDDLAAVADLLIMNCRKINLASGGMFGPFQDIRYRIDYCGGDDQIPGIVFFHPTHGDMIEYFAFESEESPGRYYVNISPHDTPESAMTIDITDGSSLQIVKTFFVLYVMHFTYKFLEEKVKEKDTVQE